jgi:RNA polymerase sigma factor (sigma-70 family)
VSESQPTPAPAGDINRLADHLFREESGKLVSVLTSLFGIERLQLAEDVVQEALIRAIQTWPFYGVPKNPAAWLTQTAKNLALDVIRREKNFYEKQPQIITTIEHWSEGDDESPQFENEIKDSRLRLFFACCHPGVPQDAQAALALKTLCGFSPGEIAAAFMTTEAAIAKRLVRARQKIREENIRFEIPSGPDAAERLAGVHQTLYLLFNEGYKASSGDTLIREELCARAIDLAELLANQPAGNQPATDALLALMLFNAARFRARVDKEGNLVRLQDQDRSLWDRKMIARGMMKLAQSASGSEATTYHLQAGIAAQHCAAESYEQTDWQQILELYDHLVEVEPTPIVHLNRAIALTEVQGPEAGLKALERLAKPLETYYLFHAVQGDFHRRLKAHEEARRHYETALKLSPLDSEKQLIHERLDQLGFK